MKIKNNFLRLSVQIGSRFFVIWGKEGAKENP
jgi:hypothetical protein